MQRILHINDYPMDAGGGAEVVLRRTVDLLRQCGRTIDTFTCADLPDARRTPRRYISNPVAQAALRDALQRFQPDVVHLHNYYHLLSPAILTTLAEHKRYRPMRVVMTAHDYHLVCPNSGGSWFRWLSNRRETIDPARVREFKYHWPRRWDQRGSLYSLLKLAQHVWNYRWHSRQRVIDLVLCPSRFVESILAPLGLPTLFLPHPAPAILSDAASTQKDHEEAPHCVFAGRLEPEKGLYEFLRLLPPDFDGRVTIIGAGSELKRCQELCAARCWSERVVFVGRLPHAQTLKIIARCHVLVQPSRVLETYGLTLIEALASGTNILAANQGAVREIVTASGVGYLFEPDDASSIARQWSAIRASHALGTLNCFDVAGFLEDRSESCYLDSLLRAYGAATSATRHAA